MRGGTPGPDHTVMGGEQWESRRTLLLTLPEVGTWSVGKGRRDEGTGTIPGLSSPEGDWAMAGWDLRVWERPLRMQ